MICHLYSQIIYRFTPKQKTDALFSQRVFVFNYMYCFTVSEARAGSSETVTVISMELA